MVSGPLVLWVPQVVSLWIVIPGSIVAHDPMMISRCPCLGDPGCLWVLRGLFDHDDFELHVYLCSHSGLCDLGGYRVYDGFCDHDDLRIPVGLCFHSGLCDPGDHWIYDGLCNHDDLEVLVGLCADSGLCDRGCVWVLGGLWPASQRGRRLIGGLWSRGGRLTELRWQS